MKQIIPANKTILRLLGAARVSPGSYRMMTCCIPLETEDGILLFHVLTRELLLLTKEEYSSAAESSLLRDHWFSVPEQLNDAELISSVRWLLLNYKKDTAKTPIRGYTILTTTDCNARCFYCYEKGCTHVTMEPATAHRTAAYIQEHCQGEEVILTWFGGEPLLNDSVIDLICRDLQEAGVSYQSKIVSNAYLFCGDMVSRAKDLWKLQRAQITLDGTEEIYNKSKSYVYPEGNPYQIVLSNIEGLLDAGIAVQIRLNISPVNGSDLAALMQDLAVRFGGRKGFCVYTQPLFDSSPNAKTAAAQTALLEAQAALEEAIEAAGLSAGDQRPLRRKPKLHHCIADSGKSVVILPDGHIGLCEHHLEDEFIGHIDRPGTDMEVVKRWRERAEEIPQCKTCFYYPDCTNLKLCSSYNGCSEHKRTLYRKKIQRSMLYELQQWKETQNS